MPIYEYRCDQGHTFEVMRRMTDAPLTACETCSAPVEQIFHPITVHFKGKGFYNTDYGTKKRAREVQESKSSESAKSADAKTAETKSGGDAAKTSESGASEKKAPEVKSGDAKAEKKASTPAPKKSSE